jgi:hypothetical protein
VATTHEARRTIVEVSPDDTVGSSGRHTFRVEARREDTTTRREIDPTRAQRDRPERRAPRLRDAAFGLHARVSAVFAVQLKKG